jgi:hypothetical protein
MTKPKRGKPTKKDEKNFRRWEMLALLHGYNELATRTDVLGQKVFFRLCCQKIEEVLKKDFDVQIPHTEQTGPTVLVLGHKAPFIVFHARDIELMRAAVEKHDRAVSDDG